ncbi:cytochrome aa3 quinol oxidase subunit III [Salibacterium qingdaonense]|uniref:Quinol oxidase subunit 3 n=1 Tax=Salibacterium qingdaonense TaxID=266892 RepID=A0A1I4INC1_9BACI|nr:cytochrome aa3 quinol oxidase subunit III [Salibacterium qingdaonense]SFL55301.1 cytochrome aa3-600 menaquinol oxidase subunit 3 [Salibacterium qingdaonense]
MKSINDYPANIPPEYEEEEGQIKIFGFWIFLAAELVLFSCLFATYLVYLDRTASGPTGTEIFEYPGVIIQTFLLLTSSFTSSIGIFELRRKNKLRVLIWMGITLLLGISFLGMEIKEFATYIEEGVSISTSAFWSSFYILVGTHGAHVTFGIIWMSIVLIHFIRKGINPTTSRKLFVASLYWHFLDAVWIFVITGVYLIGGGINL